MTVTRLNFEVGMIHYSNVKLCEIQIIHKLKNTYT